LESPIFVKPCIFLTFAGQKLKMPLFEQKLPFRCEKNKTLVFETKEDHVKKFNAWARPTGSYTLPPATFPVGIKSFSV
jgi:hypothetical protein